MRFLRRLAVCTVGRSEHQLHDGHTEPPVELASDLAFDAAECIVSEENQAYYFVSNGNPAALSSVYDDEEVVAEFPQAPVIRESLELAAPRPQTPYYSEVSGGIQREYHPPSSVDPDSTPQSATELIEAVLAGDQLL